MRNLTGKASVNNQNILYYDRIAADYDRIMEEDNLNEIVRQKVANKFCDTVPPGLVLDFGGGTGKDLLWLTQKGYRIIFCEPSPEMRKKAIRFFKKNIPESDVLILPKEKTDFTQWKTFPPFSEKVDAILINFAVLNCINDIKSLFFSLASVMNPGGNVFALILDNRRDQMMRRSRRKTIINSVFNFSFRFSVYFGPYRQTVFIHTDKEIETATKKYFELKNKENWDSCSYSLIHLVKK
jgi:SAM-dependent methyltransferase